MAIVESKAAQISRRFVQDGMLENTIRAMDSRWILFSAFGFYAEVFDLRLVFVAFW